jgi:hypothetical protein
MHPLAAACEYVMLTKAAESKNRKERLVKPVTKLLGSDENDTTYWNRFYDIDKTDSILVPNASMLRRQ